MTFWERNQLKLAPFFFLAPAILIFLIYVIYPIIDSIWVSFHEWNGMDKKGTRGNGNPCLLYTSPSPRDRTRSRMPSSA